MSKKSRKRNKRLLALAGLAGAVAMSKNKRNASIDKGIKSAEDDKGSEMLSKKTDYITKKDTSKSDVAPVVKDTSKGSGSNVRTRGKIVDSSGNTVASAGTAIADNKSKVTGILPPSQNTNMYSKVGNNNPKSRNFRKDGGRMGLKSGGRVKGCGKALRGFGKAMKGKR